MFLLLVGEARAQNVLANPGFEVGTFNGWTTFQSNNYVQSDGLAHSGTYYCKVYGQFNSTTNFTGIYQENPSAPGDTYTAGGWAYSLENDGGGIHGGDAI